MTDIAEAPTLDHANESIAADWERISSGMNTEDTGKTAPDVAETPVADEATKTAARDATGKFAKTTTAPLTGQSQEGVQEPAGDLATDQAVQEPVQAVESPKSLRKELADKHWAKLDPEIQKAWNERDQSYQHGIERYRERAEVADRFDSVFAPYRETLANLKATPQDAISALLSTDHILRHGQPQEKAAMVSQIARQFGVSLEDIANVGPLQAQLLAQAQKLQSFESQQTQVLQQQAQRELDSLTSEVMKFSEGNEHFGAVSNEVYALLPGITQQFPNESAQQKLQRAYDIAIYANPTVRSALAAQQQAAAKAEAQKKAIEARRSASVNHSPRGTLAAAPAVGSMDDTIRENWARIQGA